YDEKTKSTWLVPDFEEYGGIKRPGKGYDRVLLRVLSGTSPKLITNNNNDTIPFSYKIKTESLNDKDNKDGNLKFYIENKDAIDGLQCVFVLDHLTHNDNHGKNNDDNVKTLSTQSEEKIDYQIKQNHQSQVTLSQIPLKPFGTIHPITFLEKTTKC
ncbi:7164_t:CDS:2, partial [Gigaspora margarita]